MPGFGDQRIGFVCHGEDQVVLFPASALVGVQHGNKCLAFTTKVVSATVTHPAPPVRRETAIYCMEPA